jgi:transcriptional regulator with XRE-family HTH domain
MKQSLPTVNTNRLTQSIDLHKLIYGRNLRYYRRQASLSQRQLADISGIMQPNISLIENGYHNVCIDTIAKFAQSMDVPLWRFFDDARLVDDVREGVFHA